MHDMADLISNELFCLEENCIYERKIKRGKCMSKCILCYKFFHNECVDIGTPTVTVTVNADNPATTNVPVVLWPCPSCRTLTAQVKQLQICITTLMSSVDTIRTELQKSNELNGTIAQKCDELIAENNTLKQSVEQLKTEVINGDAEKNETDQEDDEDAAEPVGCLLIGDSIIRSVVSTSDELSVKSISGAKFQDLKKTLKQINPREEKYTDIFIVCGTNDSATKKSAAGIEKDMNAVIRLAKERSENVHVSSIVPRSDPNADMNKIEALNGLLSTAAANLDVNYIDNDKNFKYRDGSIDDSLLLPTDKLHLSACGTMKLLSNLKLEERAKASFGNGPSNWWKTKEDSPAHRFHNNSQDPPPSVNTGRAFQDGISTQGDSSEMKFRGPHHPFSNFYASPLQMWGMTFPTNEHAYNYRKAVEMGQHVTAESIRQATTPRQSQIIAQRIVTDDRWKGIKQSVMYELLQEKAQQCVTFKNDLKESQGKILIEDTGNEYWGRGQAGTGLNALGRLLMTLRDNLPLTHFTSNKRNAPFSTPANPRRYNKQAGCENCGEFSHNLRTCRHSRPLQCYSCSQFGHKRKFCSSQRMY